MGSFKMNLSERFEIKSLPKGIYIETSILAESLEKIVNTGLEKLIDLCKKNQIPIFITDVTFHEWVNKRKEEIKKKFDSIKGISDKMKKYIGYDSGINYESEMHRLIKLTEREAKKCLEIYGIEIIKNYGSVDLKKLTDMAINKIKPFENNEKGFRDTVILFMILNHAKSQGKGTYIFIVKDKIFYKDNNLKEVAYDIERIVNRYDINLILFNSIDFTKSNIKEYVEKYIKLSDSSLRSANLIKFLQNKCNISKTSIYVSNNINIKVSDFQTHYLETIKRLISIYEIQPEDIDNSSLKITDLPEGTDEGKVKITYIQRVNIKGHFEVIKYPSETVMHITEISPITEGVFAIKRTNERREIEVDIKIEGSLYLKEGKKFKTKYRFSDFNIDNIIILGKR